MTLAVLARLRTDPFVHWLGLVVATAIGLGLATVHWLGLVAGGALVGLVATSLRRALLAGLGFGVTALAVWFGYLAAIGALWAVLATGQLLLIAVAVGVAAPLVGSLVRGVL
ncbi:hypothetical protein GRX03_05935 [Halovenus sp. WSH3]|uniref:Uncharacterized protein n=1 Tax=Halovenus carboxidivorans TaxID=2692199 RepID=A0A6B0T4N9_9EURY|nr:hypothetical protein [Halovenus carboxidivorans]MXR51146.1 hypothetical protein [Halovenus carboxidivorans]